MGDGSVRKDASGASPLTATGDSLTDGSERAALRQHDVLRELCHDLLQPAATISAVAAAAQLEAELPPATRARLSQVTLEAQRIAELCRHVLRDSVETEAVLLDELAAEVVAAATVTSAGSVRVQGSQSAVVDGDAAALRRALWNLVDNGVRAAGPGGTVTVTVAVVGDWAEMTVADSGGGFGTGHTGLGGFGLGIAARVAREHGGDLSWGRSRDLGGAAVTLAVPVASAVPPERGVSDGVLR
jgi:signal transduction histidine kinase